MRNIRTKEQILEDLLKARGFNDGKEVNERIERQKNMWPENELRANVLYSIGLHKNYFSEDEVDLHIAFEIFQDRFSGWDDFINFYNKLETKDKEKFLELSHFYYNWCKEPNIAKNLDRSYKLIIMTSIIEALISEYKFRGFKSWFDKQCSVETRRLAEKYFCKYGLKEQIYFLWREYEKIHGAGKKVRIFFELYIDDVDKDYVINNFKVYDKINGVFVKAELKNVINLLYYMRSKFVHEAQIVQLARHSRDYLGHIIGSTGVMIRMSIDDFLLIFEKGFINYFKSKYD